MSKHIIECLGVSRVVIEGDKVVEVSDPIIRYCPLFDKYYGIKKLDRNSVR